MLKQRLKTMRRFAKSEGKFKSDVDQNVFRRQNRLRSQIPGSKTLFKIKKHMQEISQVFSHLLLQYKIKM